MATILPCFSWFTESIKKCSIKYFIQHYLGRYLSGELDLSQLNFELINGKCSIDGIPLDVDNINLVVSPYVPLKFLDGHLDRISISIPWSSLMSESVNIHIEGIRLTFCKDDRYKADPNQVSSMLSRSLMTSSMEMAEEIVNQEKEKFDGLEKFAQLLNSIIRRTRLSASNTVVKFILPNKRSGAGQEVELRIGHIQCEEEEIALDDAAAKDDAKGTMPDVMTKRITVEGIEILINDVLITKLNGKHTVKVRFDGNRIDTDVYLSSYIFAILNSDQLKVLQEILKELDGSKGAGGFDNYSKGKPLSSEDYRHLQEMMHVEGRSRHNTMTSSILSYNNNNWTSDSLHDGGDRFLPFDSEAKPKTEADSTEESPRVFTFNLKSPGILLCLISSNINGPVFEESQMSMPQSFIGINDCLNGILQQYSHIRLSASNLCVQATTESFEFSCINVSVYEYHDEILSNILLVKDNEEVDSIAPSVRVKMSFADSSIDIKLASSMLKLDFTLIERHYRLLEVLGLGVEKPNSSSATSMPTRHRNGATDEGELCVNIECDKLDVEMYFPVADLREDRDEYSQLHEEILLLELTELGVSISPDNYEVVCSMIDIDMKVDETIRKVFHSHSESKEISLSFSTLSSASVHGNASALDAAEFLLNTADSMTMSINYLSASTMNHNKQHNNPFQVKRKMFADEGNEQILTPGDRDHQKGYLSYNKDATKMFLYLHVPYGDVYFEDKAMFELIYNRFVNDLILWVPNLSTKGRKVSTVSSSSQPAGPHLVDVQLSMDVSSNIFVSAINTESSMTSTTSAVDFELRDCKEAATGLLLDTSNLAIRDTFLQTPPLTNFSTQPNNAFFSYRGMGDSYDSMASEALYHSVDDSTAINQSIFKSQNEFILELEIDNLNIDFKTASGRRNTLFTQNLSLGIVVGPEAERSTVVCLSSEKLMYKAEDRQLLIGNSYMDPANCVLNLCLEIKRETDALKKIKLAVQLERALLLGLDLPIYEELYEFVNVKDDEIRGYICPKVVLELHTDIVQSGVSFDILKERPTLLHAEDIYLTSMVVENTNQTLLRFFIEEALLCFKRNSLCPETMKNYIAVIDSGVIDLNVKISKDNRVELKISNNEINVKVCPDSLATLCQFLQSFAAQVANESTSEGAGGESADSGSTNEIYTHKNSNNGTDLLAEALFECSPENGSKGYASDDSSSSTGANCSLCDGTRIDESQFWVLGDDPGTGINLTKEPQVRLLTDKPIKVIENYFKVSNYNVIPEITPSTLSRYLLEKMSLRVSLYGGKDFDDIPSDCEDELSGEESSARSSKWDATSQSNLSMRSRKSNGTTTTLTSGRDQKVRFSQNSVVWENIDLLSNNGYLTNAPAENHFNFKCTGGSKRKNDTCVVLVLNRIKLLFENFDDDYELAWRFFFLVQEIEILDRVNASKIRKILYEYFSETTPRRKYSNMFSVRLTCHRNFQDKNEECDLKVSLKPLRVNIDQDTLIFLMNFFTTTNEILSKVFANLGHHTSAHGSDSGSEASVKRARTESKTSFDEDASFRNGSGKSGGGGGDDAFSDEEDDEDDSMLSQRAPSTMSLDTQGTGGGGGLRGRRGSTSSNGSFDNIFIKSFSFAPDVPIRLDYHGKHIDLKQGALPGLFLGLAQLNQSELHLKKLSNKHGLLGWEKLIAYVVEEWAKDIKRNQLPSILGGVGPMHSFIQLFQGFRDLICMPIEQYRRDQRIVRGIQRGTYAFSISAAMATLELANRLVYLLQSTAQFAHDVVTPPTPGSGNNRQLSTIHNSQPRDLREGMTVAYTVLREGFHEAGRGVTNACYTSDDMSGRLGEVVRHVPSTIVRPIIGLTQAASSVLVGMRNQLTPEARKDDHEKWKNANER